MWRPPSRDPFDSNGKIVNDLGVDVIYDRDRAALEAKGLDRPLPRPDERQPSERDLQLVCWELIIPKDGKSTKQHGNGKRDLPSMNPI